MDCKTRVEFKAVLCTPSRGSGGRTRKEQSTAMSLPLPTLALPLTHGESSIINFQLTDLEAPA